MLDTHAFLWYVSGDPRLSEVARTAINAPQTKVYVSLISMWEVAIKHAKGRLELDEPPEVFFASEMAKNDFDELPLRAAHVFAAAALPLVDRTLSTVLLRRRRRSKA